MLGISHLFNSAGWHFELGSTLDAVTIDIDGYSENVGLGNFTAADRDGDSLRGQLFISAARAFAVSEKIKIQPSLRLAGVFQDDDFDPITVRFQDGGPSALVPVAQRDQAALALQTSLALIASDRFTLRAGYDGLFGSEFNQHAASITVSLAL